MTNDQNLIQAVEQADSSSSLLTAVEILADAKIEAAIPTLIAVLSYNNPGAAVAAVDGLVQLGDVAVEPLLNLLDEYNYGGRAWAIRALAQLADPRALDTLLSAAETDFALSVRRAAAKGLGNVQWSKLSPEEIPSAQGQVLKTLQVTSHDPEWVVRYASVVGLQGLATAVAETQPDYWQQIVAHLKQLMKDESDLAVCTRVQFALAQLQPEKVKAG